MKKNSLKFLFVIINILLIFGFLSYCSQTAETIIYEKFDSHTSKWYVGTCVKSGSLFLDGYNTYFSVLSEKKDTVLVKVLIDSNDIFDDCKNGRGKIINTETTVDISKNNLFYAEVSFSGKESITFPVFLKF